MFLCFCSRSFFVRSCLFSCLSGVRVRSSATDMLTQWKTGSLKTHPKNTTVVARSVNFWDPPCHPLKIWKICLGSCFCAGFLLKVWRLALVSLALAKWPVDVCFPYSQSLSGCFSEGRRKNAGLSRFCWRGIDSNWFTLGLSIGLALV